MNYCSYDVFLSFPKFHFSLAKAIFDFHRSMVHMRTMNMSNTLKEHMEIIDLGKTTQENEESKKIEASKAV